MEKRKAHYDLVAVKTAVKERGLSAFTKTALIGAQAMGLSKSELVGLVCTLRQTDFYKSLTTHEASQVWQDVYHLAVPGNKLAYIKITLRKDGSVVIQFKEK